LVLEGCAVELERALRGMGLGEALPIGVLSLLRESTARAVRQALTVPAQITELATAARELGIRIMVLKGTARLLDGALPGSRSMSDIDVLTARADAARLHTWLRLQSGYDAFPASPEHHLPTLTRPGALPVEVHVQLSPRRSPLDARIWRDAREVSSPGLLVPSPTGALLHVLEHGALVHWAVRYRLRDLLDLAAGWVPDVDRDEVVHHLGDHRERRVLLTMLGAARRFAPTLPLGTPLAWRTVRRVARARYAAAASIRDSQRAKSLCIAAGVLAEVSPRALLRPAQLALFGVTQARVDAEMLAGAVDRDH
jgi:hypothetical protein